MATEILTLPSPPTPLTHQGVAVLLGNGDGTFQSPLKYNTGTEFVSLAVADFNGDGNADVAVAIDGSDEGPGSGAVSVLFGNGDGTFQPGVTYGSAGDILYRLRFRISTATAERMSPFLTSTPLVSFSGTQVPPPINPSRRMGETAKTVTASRRY